MSKKNKVYPPKSLLSQPTVGTAACPACKHAAQIGAKFCPDCGIRLDGPPQPAAGPSTEPQHQEPDAAERPQDMETQTPASPAGTLDAAETDPATCSCGCQPVQDAAFCHQCGGRIEWRRRLHLVCETNGQPLGVVELDGHDVTIGRDEGNSVVICGDRHASARHAQVTCREGVLVLEDLGSSNGTFLCLHRPIRLEVGDEFIVGTTLMRLEAGAVS